MEKNNIKKIIYAVVGLIVVIITSLIIVRINKENKTKYFEEIFINSYQFSDKFFAKLDLRKYLEDNTTLNISLGTTKDSEDKINFKINNYLNKNIFSTNINYKNYDLNYLRQDEKYYLQSNTLLDNTYELNKNSTFNKLTDGAINLLTSDDMDINYLLKEVKDTLVKSIDTKYITKNTTTTIINNKEEVVIRYNYPLNSKSLNKLVTNISKNRVIKNLIIKSLNNIYKQEVVTSDNIIATLNNMIINGTFNVYVKNNRIRKVSIYLTNDAEIDFYITDDYMMLNLNSTKNNNIVTINYNRKSNELSLSVVKKSQKIFDTIINLQENFKIDYNFYANNKKYEGSISNTYTNPEKNAGIINFTHKNSEITIEYAKTHEDINSLDVSTAKAITSPSANEKLKIKDAYNELKNSGFIKNFTELLNDLNS